MERGGGKKMGWRDVHLGEVHRAGLDPYLGFVLNPRKKEEREEREKKRKRKERKRREREERKEEGVSS